MGLPRLAVMDREPELTSPSLPDWHRHHYARVWNEGAWIGSRRGDCGYHAPASAVAPGPSAESGTARMVTAIGSISTRGPYSPFPMTASENSAESVLCRTADVQIAGDGSVPATR